MVLEILQATPWQPSRAPLDELYQRLNRQQVFIATSGDQQESAHALAAHACITSQTIVSDQEICARGSAERDLPTIRPGQCFILGGWFWVVLERKFQAPGRTALGKIQSYGLTRYLAMMVTGFNLQARSLEDYQLKGEAMAHHLWTHCRA